MCVIELNKDNFEDEVLKSDKPVLLDFFAVWCGPCKMVSPIIDEIANERNDIKVGKIDVDQNMELAQAYQVASIPTLIVIKDGKVAKKVIGAIPKEEILEML